MTAQRGGNLTADTFKALVNNAWFKLGARLLGWVAVPSIFTLIGIALTLRSDVNDTREFSLQRAKDNETFQAQVLLNDTNTKHQLEALRDGQVAQGLQISNMSGILAQMNNEKIAERNARLPGMLSGGGGF